MERFRWWSCRPYPAGIDSPTGPNRAYRAASTATILRRLPGMKYVVTGAAGFIGSHLCEELLRGGHQVTGIDAFIPYYPVPAKERNLAGLKEQPNFHFHRLDLRTDAADAALADADVIFHLAAMPGLV